MIQVSHLTKYYGDKTALADVSFSVPAGETVGLLGPNGAGKSTTMNILTGNLSPSAGSVRICGADMLEEPMEAKKHIGYLPELPPLYPDMTVEGYLKFVYALKKCRLPRDKHLGEILEATETAAVRKRLIKNLSKGYRQRIGLAQALIGNPAVLILDEPTVGLDPQQIIEMRALIKAMARERTIIISSHILSEIEATCSRILLLNEGKLIADDTPGQLSAGLSGGRLFVGILGPEKEAAALLKNTPGVLEVTPRGTDADGVCGFALRCEEEEKTRLRIATALKQSEYLLAELRREEVSLEKIFLTLTGRKGGAR